MKAIIYAIGAISVSLTVIPLFRYSAWWVRAGDFPRLQIAIISIAATAILAIFCRPFNFYCIALILLLLLSSAYQIYNIIPYVPFYPNQVEKTKRSKPERTIKLLISNVLIENRDSKKLIDLITDVKPDVVLLAESDERWLNELKQLDNDFQTSVKVPLNNGYGMALYSRLELTNTEVKYLVEDDVPSIHTEITLASGDKIKFFGLHPRPPIPTEATSTTERDAELVLVGKIVRDTEIPTVIAGDLNDVAWSRTTNLFQKISGMLDPRIGRGLYSSFHADYPFMRFPLDHVFHSNHFRLVELKRLRHIGSDHFPMLVVLNIENGADDSQEQPEANTADRKEANQMIKDAEEKTDKKLPDVESNSK